MPYCGAACGVARLVPTEKAAATSRGSMPSSCALRAAPAAIIPTSERLDGAGPTKVLIDVVVGVLK